MKSSIKKKSGLGLVIVSSLVYIAFRIQTLVAEFSVMSLIAMVCEFTLLGLVIVESMLLASTTAKKARVQDEGFLIESAKNVLFSSSTQVVSDGEQLTKVDTQKIIAQKYNSKPVDAIVFAEDATMDELRRCFLSLSLLDGLDNVYVIDEGMSLERKELCSQFHFSVTDTFRRISATTQSVLICRGTDILFPDACSIARTYDVDEGTFLELRSVYSDERALGANGLVNVSDKRQMIRESLSTRGLATWSTGPAMVSSSVIKKAEKASSAQSFFGWCERNGVHGTITDEIISEEISREQTISEIKWRSTDLIYATVAWRNVYKEKGTKLIGSFIKLWSLFLSIGFVRRLATIALILGFVVVPQYYGFINTTYFVALLSVIALSCLGGYLSGDNRGIFARVREFYFDIEAVMFSMYKVFLKPEYRESDQSIVKKLPSVSSLLVLTDAILVYRIYIQSQGKLSDALSPMAHLVSLFAGYALVVSMLIGLSMIIVRQSRTATRREVSRGANLNGEPVSMIDLSPGGVGCISVSPIDIDTSVTFESSLPNAKDSEKFTCQGVVRSCIEWEGSYRLGLEFNELDQKQQDTLETYCSIIFPHAQARFAHETSYSMEKGSKINGKAERRFLSYAATFVALGAIIFANLSRW